MTTITLATCCLNQWALDFDGNLKRSLKSFKIAKEKGAIYRLGPELELCGYGCNDHLLEYDTMTHCFEVLAKLLESIHCQDIIGDVGMPIVHFGVRYNCRVIFYNRRILLIRPKKFLANDGNYREMRWFTPWMKSNVVEDFHLPSMISKLTGQSIAPFGDAILQTSMGTFGTEVCEELFTPNSPHIVQSLSGVEVFTNGSGSHHEFQKLKRRIDLIREATMKCGGVYLYSNQQGCDGERVYYDGSALIIVNGDILAQTSQFSLLDVEVVCATVQLEQIRTFRASNMSRGMQAATIVHPPKVSLELNSSHTVKTNLSPIINPKYLTPNEEIYYGPACWLWDYLRRSKQKGYFLPLSGGIDSCSTALIVYSMCTMVFESVLAKDEIVLADLRGIIGDDSKEYIPKSPKDICGKIFHTCYMGTSNSGLETQTRARILAETIGRYLRNLISLSYHLNINIDGVIKAILSLFTLVTTLTPKYKVHGGSGAENLALQNIQARSRMVLAYLFAQLLLWVRGLSGSLLVLGSANVDETLRGYFTKYDCSSADLNPIGGISKVDLISFVKYYSTKEGFQFLSTFVDAPPTAELEPITDSYVQTDEVDMGMTYAELSTFGTLRKVHKLGPVSMFDKLLGEWGSSLTPSEIATKVKKFFFYYSINRHKTTTLPPSYHMSMYSPDDNRYDLRPFLYNSSWKWQFDEIDKRVNEMNKIK
ncbi:NAD synthetase 1 [Globomyces pollinis-pini]|nr:NAD synthetase 1 [Globomyces pollinis-pini]